jgi:EAL domain-containing protein (putative c-di-GMP-specific phosphodiesterase class I)
MRLLFAEDPLIQSEAGAATSRFATWFTLENQYNDLLSAVKRIAVTAEEQRETAAARARAEGRQATRQAMDPNTLAKLEALLGRTDLSNLMRRQAIANVAGSGQPMALIRELTISIADLQSSVAPDIDLFGDQWLFQRLTQTLDRRMLAALARAEDQSLTQQVSLNLNVSTILSPEFVAYDQMVKPEHRSSVVIEMQKIDIFADPGAFLFARDFLKERGYKLALDGVTFMVLPFIDREKLGLDLIKVQYSSDMLVDMPGQGIHRMKEYVERCGRARMILYRIEDERALKFGQGFGISLFQGRYIDKLLGQRKP